MTRFLMTTVMAVALLAGCGAPEEDGPEADEIAHKTANACTKAGGHCVALAPGTCDDGAVGDSREYSCGAGLGIECCLPAPEPTGPACKSYHDCKGPLPDFCMKCSANRTACAHWACEKKHCTMETCG